MCVVSVNVNFEKLQQARPDYVFHSYGEICNFIYCLLLKTRVDADLPGIHEWEAYMDVSKLESFRSLPIEDFLVNYPYGKELAAGKTSEIREFRVKCRIFFGSTCCCAASERNRDVSIVSGTVQFLS